MQAVLIGPRGRTVLESTTLTIGSSPDNLLVIDNVKVSAHHAEIRQEEQGFSITDLGSIHGTYVNGERLDFNTPHILNRGNAIAIGDTVFTYVVEDTPQIEQVPPISPHHEDSSGMPSYENTEMLPSPVAYGMGTMSGPPGNQQQTGADTQSTFPQQYMPPTLPQPGYVGPEAGYVPVAQGQRRNRRFIWIGLGLLVVIALAVVGYIFFTRSTPEKTLDTYCNALLGQDYLTAYNQLSTPLQKSETESEFAHMLDAQGKITSCTHGSASVSGATVLVELIFASSSGQNSNSPVTLVQDNGNTWKISVPFPPAITLITYCHALKNKDYQTAYDQLSTTVKSQISEAGYETNESLGESSVGGISNCTVSNVNESDSQATGTITFVVGSGQTGQSHYTLMNESGIWKISAVQ
jgi:FHA domain-containing protein